MCFNKFKGETLKNLFNLYFFGFAILLFCLTVLSCKPEAEKTNVQNKIETGLNAEAPPETQILGQLVGTWDIDQSIVDSDGSWGNRKRKAIWRWYYILEGNAIQDDWISFDSLNNEHVSGTNIRIYNEEEKQWYMAWIDKTVRRLATFTATNDSGMVIMDGHNAKGRHIKNIFYNITENEFDWRQEWTQDEGKSWIIVTMIHATRRI